MADDKPRLRVPAGSSRERLGTLTVDNVSNFVARLGISQPNLLAGSSYDFQPISRLQQMLEWAYRGSWVVGAAVDIVADDMTRAGVRLNTELDPKAIKRLHTAMRDTMLWQNLNEAVKWSRLYGGALLVMLIDGQDLATPLEPETVGQGQLKGFQVIDRWMVQSALYDIVKDYGPDYGYPIYYDVIATAPFLPRQRIHYTRCIRVDGVRLPFRQRIAENGWGMSVIERIHDRLLAFDSGTMGAAQLLYKAYLRTYKVEGYRTLVGVGGDLTERFMRSMELMRMLQSNEGLTVIDSKDEFETHSYSFGGISDILQILGQQLSGALGIPLTRLFGESPNGMSSTGESDMRNYYDMIQATQEARLRRPLSRVFEVFWQSTLGGTPPEEFDFEFLSLYQLNDMEKSELAQRDADAINSLHQGGVITTKIALLELKQSSIVTGRFTNISDQDIKDSEAAPDPWEQPEPAPGEPGGGGPPGGGGGASPASPGASAPSPKAAPPEPGGETT